MIGTFGGSFTTGSSSGPVYFTVLGDFQTQIFVSQLGNNSYEVGFVVKAPNGTIIYQRMGGSWFNSSKVFTTFCPTGGCESLNTMILTIMMTDAKGNGWNGNVLAIKQNNTVVGTFGSAFTYRS